MLNPGFILFVSFAYMGMLFAVAYYGDRRADAGASVIANPYIYSLSLAVYCTAWTYYGSVGLAARHGPDFLPIYLGPTLMSALGWVVLRKIIRISRIHRITSIADFIASRYGKSTVLGGVVTLIAVVGVIPYIALQLKAISVSFLILHSYPDITLPIHFTDVPFFRDTAFYTALLLAVFAVLFGTRHLAATERHEGLVAAIAFESIVKLAACLGVGIYVTYCLYDGFGEIMEAALADPELSRRLTFGAIPNEAGAWADWGLSIFIAMMAVLLLPRQFQVAVVENVNEDHLEKALWLFPLYLLAINLFVLPIALGGVLRFPDGAVDPDTFVLTLPLAHGNTLLALLVYIGGMSAATGMVIVETVALSTMICNDLVMPVLLRPAFLSLYQRADLSRALLAIRRISIFLVVLLAYAYFRFIGEFYGLVSIGLVSFAAVAQFAPAILGGIFWKGGNRAGALTGLLLGFGVWGYTLVVPSLAQTGFLSISLITNGPFGIELLKPFALFGLTDFSHVGHAVFWSMLFNIGAYVGVSVFTRATAIEHTQATLFVDVFRYSKEGESRFWRGTASAPDLRSLLERFLGRKRAENEFRRYARRHSIDWDQDPEADAELVDYAEKQLAAVIGSASARVMVASVVKEEPLELRDVMRILDETRQVIAYSRELEKTTSELKAANQRLQELDRLKDEFVSTVTHELRTPLTSVRALAEILYDTPDLPSDRQEEFAGIIIKESDRLTRLITQVLDIQKIESGRLDWQFEPLDLRDAIQDAVSSTRQWMEEKGIGLSLDMPDACAMVSGDRDRLIQVLVNLISNAVKFSDGGVIAIRLISDVETAMFEVKDNGIGIRLEDQPLIFNKFQQIKSSVRGRPTGSGLGLSITRRIVEHHGGTITVESQPGKGATFRVVLPALNHPHSKNRQIPQNMDHNGSH